VGLSFEAVSVKTYGKGGFLPFRGRKRGVLGGERDAGPRRNILDRKEGKDRRRFTWECRKDQCILKEEGSPFCLSRLAGPWKVLSPMGGKLC